MKKYRISAICCDEHTNVIYRLTDKEAQLLNNISDKTKKISPMWDMPIVDIEPIEDDAEWNWEMQINIIDEEEFEELCFYQKSHYEEFHDYSDGRVVFTNGEGREIIFNDYQNFWENHYLDDFLEDFDLLGFRTVQKNILEINGVLLAKLIAQYDLIRDKVVEIISTNRKEREGSKR